MLAKRIIPCLDVKDGKVVKGTQFKNLTIEGDPAVLAYEYEEQGADELVFLDITASYEKRKTMLQTVSKTADTISIPFTVGGGIKSIEDIQAVLLAGADKVSINSAAVRNPELIRKGAEIFGSQCIVIAIDAKRVYVNGEESEQTKKSQRTIVQTPEGRCWWEVYLEGGRVATGIDAIQWANKVKELGAGELLPTSMDSDGMKNGYDIPLVQKLGEVTKAPVIASGGAGNCQHIYDVLTKGKADAALAASIFHRGKYTVREVKQQLRQKGVPIRLL